jgi:hypothetical protein
MIPFPGQVFREGERGPKQVDGYWVHSCGSQHVLRLYPTLVSQRRQRAGRFREMGCRLIVHLDVDHTDKNPRSVADRLRELAKLCTEQSIDSPSAQEPVAHLLPRRNIETWIEFFLKGPPVDESVAYPHLTMPADAEPAARAFAQHAQAKTTPPAAPPSLITGLTEFRKVI